MKAPAAAVMVLAAGANAFVNPSSSSSSLSAVKSAATASTLRMAAAPKSDDMPVNLVNPAFFWGEEGYRNYVAGFKDDALINRAYPVLDRVREKKLLTKTAELGLLGALEDAGLTLSQAEALLPAVEDSGLLSFTANNADLLLNTAGFLAVEPAELALPLIVNAIKAGPTFFNTVAAGAVLSEALLVVLTQSPVLGLLGAVPLLGTAFAASTAASILGDLKVAAALRPVKAAAAAAANGPRASISRSLSSAPKAAAKRPSVAPRPAPVASVSTGRSKLAKKAVGNVINLPKRRPKVT